MNRLALAALLVVALAVLGAAVSTRTAHASDLSLQFGSGTPPGTMTLGGVTGPLSWSGGNWTMTVAGQTFATGTFNSVTGRTTVTSMPGFASCQAGCATTVSTKTLSGTLSITNHGAFVSAVAHWAGAHQAALTAAGMTKGSLVSAAARGSAHPTGQSTASTTSSTVTKGSASPTAGGRGNATSAGHATGAGAANGGIGAGHGGGGTSDSGRVGASGSDSAGKVDNGGGHGAGRGR